jgi:hypothetical protein
MAKQTESQWAKVTETVELEDTGDILAPLKRVQKQYSDKADWFAAHAFGDNTKAYAQTYLYYHRARMALEVLING